MPNLEIVLYSETQLKVNEGWRSSESIRWRQFDEVEGVGLWNQPDLALHPSPDSSQTTSSSLLFLSL